MTVLGGDATYEVKYDSDQGMWLALGPGLFSGGRHSTKQQAIDAAKTLAGNNDSIKIFNKNGSVGRTISGDEGSNPAFGVK